jgi:hypothetical protein
MLHNIQRVGGATAGGLASLQGSENPSRICVGVKSLYSQLTHQLKSLEWRADANIF